MIDLSIVIVSYNTKDFLLNCLHSIEQNSRDALNIEVIIVDNASVDGTTDEISKLKYPISKKNITFKFIQNKKNVGFSAANNIGVTESKGTYVLFLNPDTVLHENTLETMVSFMDFNKECGAATCRLELTDGTLDDASHRGFPTPWNSFSHFSGLSKIFPKSKLLNGYSLAYLDTSKIHEIDACAGAFMIVRRTAGEQVDWWDEDFFFYGEDLDFCYRLKKSDWKIYFVPTASILHFKGVSHGMKSISKEITTASRETKIRSTKARFDAMKIFYKKHYVEKYPRVISLMVEIAIRIRERLNLSKIEN